MLWLYQWIYSGLYSFLLLVYLPLCVYRALFQKKPFHIRGRLAAAQPLPISPGNPRIWIHAVSVGEVRAIQPLVAALQSGSADLVISTVTEAGQALARSLFGNQAHVLYFPLDWKWLCRRYLLAINPSLVLLMETEIWPGFITAANRLGIPVILINGRISDRSFPRYQKIRFFLQPILDRIAAFCVQSQQDAERIISLGAPASRVHQVGNLKYDYRLTGNLRNDQGVERVRQILRADKEDLLWICGSTREGEEEILLRVFDDLEQQFPSLRLLLAPRHPHRAPEVCRLLTDRRIRYTTFSRLDSTLPDQLRVLVLDVVGELAHLYQLADIVFVGGSLVNWGGHNIIEAAFFGKAVLFGPHMQNFREIASTFVSACAAVQVSSHEELAIQVRELLKDRAARQSLGEKARRVVSANQGAVSRTLDIVRQYL